MLRRDHIYRLTENQGNFKLCPCAFYKLIKAQMTSSEGTFHYLMEIVLCLD